MNTGFAAAHPALSFIFFAAVLAGGMCFTHPLFLALSLGGALLYHALLHPGGTRRALRWMLPLFAVAALANPLLVQRGETVLLWLGQRRFTLEALAYGLAAGGTFLTVLLWFGCFHRVMTSDRLQQLLAPLAPSLALVFSMTLRLVPRFSHKASQIAEARRCIGRGASSASRHGRIEAGAQVLSALGGWALEGAVQTADSMRARGWGCGRRSRYALWRFGRREKALSAVLVLALGLLAAGVAGGGAQAEYYPRISIALRGGWTALALTGYGTLCFLPSIVTVWEGISWRISRSKI